MGSMLSKASGLSSKVQAAMPDADRHLLPLFAKPQLCHGLPDVF